MVSMGSARDGQLRKLVSPIPLRQVTHDREWTCGVQKVLDRLNTSSRPESDRIGRSSRSTDANRGGMQPWVSDVELYWEGVRRPSTSCKSRQDESRSS